MANLLRLYETLKFPHTLSPSKFPDVITYRCKSDSSGSLAYHCQFVTCTLADSATILFSVGWLKKPDSQSTAGANAITSTRKIWVVESARDLGVVIDSKLSLSAHVAALCRSGFYHLRQLRPVLRSLTHEAARTLVQAFTRPGVQLPPTRNRYTWSAISTSGLTASITSTLINCTC